MTRTDAAGKFTLGMTGGDVPAGADVPVVIQVGKWQRQITVPNVSACTNTALTDTNLMRLPRTQAEGHIPRIALTTGELDALECLLRKIGIADSEFTPETASGRVNFYAGGNGTSSYDATLNGGAAFTPVHPWWDSLDNLKKYDIVLHSCEGSQGSFDANTPPLSAKSPAARQALLDYANMGGRVSLARLLVRGRTTGLSINRDVPPPRRNSQPVRRDHRPELSDRASTRAMDGQRGRLDDARYRDHSAEREHEDCRRRGRRQHVAAVDLCLHAEPPSVQYVSATTPIPGGQCGRVVFSDLHVSAGAGTGSDVPNRPYPTGCVTTDLSPQEKVLEFMLFDIGSCVVPIVP